MDPEERRRYLAQRAEWERTTRDFEAIYERLKERWRAEDLRRERRRARLRRLTLGLLGR